jgi:hypothetical protein
VTGIDITTSNVAGIQYASSSDTLYVYYDYVVPSSVPSSAFFLNEIGYFPLVSSGGSPQQATSKALQPFFANSTLSVSGQFISGPMTFTPSYLYAVFSSTATPSQGSYLLQFTNPLVLSGSSYTPKSAVAFPSQLGMLAVALDETATSATSGVLFISTSNGQLLKYRYTDPGTGTITVATPNYNSDTQVSSANPSLNYQTYSKTTQAIYLSSSSPTGGIWRVPFYDCAIAASCASCAALDDPYCGWCPLSGACTTNTSCSTGKMLTNRPPQAIYSPPFPSTQNSDILLRAPTIFQSAITRSSSAPKKTSSHSSMQRAIVSALLLALLACIARPAGAVIPGVLQFSEGNATVQGPIYQTGLTSSGTILWATAPGGLVYQINATNMQYISSTTLPSPTPSCSGTVFLGLPTCLFTDDTRGRVYVCYAPTSGTCMSLYILNATMGVVSSVSYAPTTSSAIYNLPLSQHYYDPASRMFASLSYVPGNIEFGIQLYNVSSDSVRSGAILVDAQANNPPNGISGILYTASGDTLYIFYYYIPSSPHFYDEIGYITGVSAGGSLPAGNEPLAPFFASSLLTTSGQFVSGPLTFTSSFTYSVFYSTSIPSQGSYLFQFGNPIATGDSVYSAKSAISFPTQPSFLAVALDETAVNSTSGVLFISTSNGQLLKYRYTDPGSGLSIAVTTPNYNTDTQVSSANPTFSFQSYSKTTQSIYLSSPSLTGGIWRVPFYDCGAATSCSSCAALNDPYCGWCPAPRVRRLTNRPPQTASIPSPRHTNPGILFVRSTRFFKAPPFILLPKKTRTTNHTHSLMRRVIIPVLLLALLACLACPGAAVMGGVLQFTQGGSPVQAPVYQVALGSSGSVLWAVAPGGLLYQINATSMQYINSTTFPQYVGSGGPTGLGNPTCLFVDDTYSRVYVCYAPNPGTYMSLYIVDAASLNTLGGTPYSYLPPQKSGSVYNLAVSQHYYDHGSRILACLSYLPNNAHNEAGVNIFNVSGDAMSQTISFTATSFDVTGVEAIQYESSSDSLVVYTYQFQYGGFQNFVQSKSAVSSGGSSQDIIQIPLDPFYGQSTSGQYISGPMTFLSTYDYAIYTSTTIPSQGAYLLQFSNPIGSANPYVPKSAVAFPTQDSLLGVALDETATGSTSGVLFLSTSNGQLLKYRYSDPGGGSSISVTTPNYNGDTVVASTYPTFTYQTYSKTTQAIYLSSASPTGGIWRVPFCDCGVATSCSSCAALNDPYCGWCPLSGVCTTNASCATGKTIHKQTPSGSFQSSLPSPRHTKLGHTFARSTHFSKRRHLLFLPQRKKLDSATRCSAPPSQHCFLCCWHALSPLAP